MKIFKLLILVVFTSCNAPKNSGEMEVQSNDSLFVQNHQVEEQKQKRSFEMPVDINDIKSLDNLLFTSGVLPHSDTSKFCKPDSSNFLGFYILINRKVDKTIGTLYIQTTDQPENWRSDSENEVFTSIKLLSDDIVIWDSLRVGLSEVELKRFIDQQFHYKKGQTIYADFEDYEGIFTLKNDSIVSLEVKTKCNWK